MSPGRIGVAMLRWFTWGATSLAAFLWFPSAAQGTTWYVDRSVASPGDGRTPETAFGKIQEGIDGASDGDTVIVFKGIYGENIRFNGKNIVLTSTNPLAPEVVIQTVIDGRRLTCAVGFLGTENETCVLSGFTIRNGSADAGGGIFGRGTHATVKNCLVTENLAGYGGGLYHCDGVISDNAICGNSASINGGGLCRCNGTISNNIISDNSASLYGRGGGLWGCNGVILNNTISGNFATDDGGGLFKCNGTIQNNLITGNWAGNCGGGLFHCEATIQNNTIVANTAEEGGGGVHWCEGPLRNCIIWGNWGPRAPQVCRPAFPTYSCIQDWRGGGVGNTSKDPQFADPERGYYRLRATSPCIDAGANYYWSAWPQRDLDGNVRLAGQRVDMGCYEYGASPDSDGDLLSDEQELLWQTDISREDTDGDELRDGLELLRGTDPLSPTARGTIRIPSEIPTIQAALCLALNGETIVVASGTYRENLLFCGTELVVQGAGTAGTHPGTATVIDGAGSSPVVRFSGTESEACVLAGFVIAKGWGYWGGGISGGTSENRTHATIRNNVICGNRADYGAGLAFCDGRIENNTVVENTAVTDGGGLRDCHGVIGNCIIWDNTAGGSGSQLHLSAIPLFSCIQDWTESGESSPPVGLPASNGHGRAPSSGQGNIGDSPLFVDPDGPDDAPKTYDDNDYRLLPDSPCIDAGVNEDWMWGTLDLDGNARICKGASSVTVDMGAYELFRATIVKVEETREGGIELTWTSQPNDTYIILSSVDPAAGGWMEEATLPSHGSTTLWTDPAPAAPIKFYRVQIK